MKKLVLGIMIIWPMVIYGQNLQLHYDGTGGIHSDSPSRDFVTATFDFYKMDDHGSGWWFVDFDFNDHSEISLAYVEIARDQIFGTFPLRAHVEFNGGLFNGGVINNWYHIGAMKPFTIQDFYFDVALMYSYKTKSNKHDDMKFSINYSYDLCNGRVSMIGFFNIWTQDTAMNSSTGTGKTICLFSEPQFWYNINRSFSVGSELELSHNYLFDVKGLQLYPTLAVRYFF
ncbi:DUF5020 family protein [candidate division KSB1 bacterium]|nr:DUF5020 family protein [candidate division KSB1 bacterium]